VSGDTIGPYKLLQQIGEGGMGVVFMAEQAEPIQRTVALKIIKPGMDTRQVIARFEAERQALAMMDHPNIAKVLDAGTTDTGRPFFVMELVKGVPITKYCDDNQLSIRGRLELFKPVCEAVQHAHQKGIIHRDLKPTNVLVAEYDNHAVPKIIDFGVAKATAQKITERTMFTEFGQVIGTIEYMSPEQAKFNQLDIDTRSDIYGLGVLLYELLTASTPFERQRLRNAAFDEVLRIIREEEPPKPSTRLNSSETLPAIAANRHTAPARLSRDVSGELDWIVMKCLEKDRNRRYETASDLGNDIRRYLGDEPIQACPPSAAYRMRKFVRRNKLAMITASFFVVALLIGVTGLAISNHLIDEQRQRAEEKFIRARSAVSNIVSKAAMGVGQWSQLPPNLRKQIAQEATAFYESFIHDGTVDPSLLYETAVGYRLISEVQYSFDELDLAITNAQKSVDILEQVVPQNPRNVEYERELAYSRFLLGHRLYRKNNLAEAESSLKAALDLYQQVISSSPDQIDHSRAIRCLHVMGLVQQQRGTWSRDADMIVGQIIKFSDDAASSAHNSGAIRANVAYVLNEISWSMATAPDEQFRDPANAIKLAAKAGDLTPKDGNVWNTLGVAQYYGGKSKSAIESLENAIKLRSGGDPFDSLFLAMAHWQLDHNDEAREWYDRAIELLNKNKSENKELIRFRSEAAALLGISDTQIPNP
jgi:serine/threonine protein kinase/tetratricopeptide (TPR) repeat protein